MEGEKGRLLVHNMKCEKLVILFIRGFHALSIWHQCA